jgi:hypothetical protein
MGKGMPAPAALPLTGVPMVQPPAGGIYPMPLALGQDLRVPREPPLGSPGVSPKAQGG